MTTENFFHSLDEMLEISRADATGELDLRMFEWHSGRASGMVSAGLHLGLLDPKTHDLFSEIRQSWAETYQRRIAKAEREAHSL